MNTEQYEEFGNDSATRSVCLPTLAVLSSEWKHGVACDQQMIKSCLCRVYTDAVVHDFHEIIPELQHLRTGCFVFTLSNSQIHCCLHDSSYHRYNFLSVQFRGKSYPCKQTLNVLKDLNYWFPEANDIGKSAAKGKAVVLEAVNRRLVAVMIPMTPKNTCGQSSNNLSVLDLCQTSRALIFSHKQSDACAKALIMTQRASKGKKELKISWLNGNPSSKSYLFIYFKNWKIDQRIYLWLLNEDVFL